MPTQPRRLDEDTHKQTGTRWCSEVRGTRWDQNHDIGTTEGLEANMEKRYVRFTNEWMRKQKEPKIQYSECGAIADRLKNKESIPM